MFPGLSLLNPTINQNNTNASADHLIDYSQQTKTTGQKQSAAVTNNYSKLQGKTQSFIDKLPCGSLVDEDGIVGGIEHGAHKNSDLSFQSLHRDNPNITGSG